MINYNWMVYLNVINVVLMFLLIFITLYGMIVLIKLAKRGIKALDVYIEKNQKESD